MIFQTKINGIACYCRVDSYIPGRPDKTSGAMEDAEEGYDEDFEYIILDHRYIQAPWLQRQLTEEDQDRLIEEFHVTLLEEKYCYGH